MSQLQYDINTYLAFVKMSSKVRILVEGRDDKVHVSNVISLLCKEVKFKVDTAVDLKGICKVTGKNHRAKVEKTHELAKSSSQYANLIFLCDREVRGFAVTTDVQDEIGGHYVDGKLSWTMGHSIENYFLKPEFMEDGFRYLTSSAFKDQAIALFSQCFPSSLRLIAKLTLAAGEFKNVSYPCGVVSWRSIRVSPSGDVSIDFALINNPVIIDFEGVFRSYESCIDTSGLEVCAQLCRGHTAIVILKRIFAACLFFALRTAGDEAAEYEANLFDGINEAIISNALSESWIKGLEVGKAAYPVPLIEAVSCFAT